MDVTFQLRDLFLLVLPGVIAFVNRPSWSGKAKFGVAVAFCFVAALGELWYSGGCNLADLPGTFIKTMGIVMASYATIWKAWKVGDQIEEKINSGDPEKIR